MGRSGNEGIVTRVSPPPLDVGRDSDPDDPELEPELDPPELDPEVVPAEPRLTA